MARFRLRFLLQEFDLVGPEVVIGRSPECQVTLEDPLVSRRHAVIRISGDVASVQDLGSRNGVLVNGERTVQEKVLKDGDRIRLGTQELVFYVPKELKDSTRTTGYMRVCERCGVPFPEQALQCPHCGGGIVEEETLSGIIMGPQRSWTFDLLGEVIDRALRAGRVADAERILRRAGAEIDERLANGDRIEPRHLHVAIDYVIAIARKNGDTQWLRWLLGLHRAMAIAPTGAIIEALEAGIWKGEDARKVVDDFVEWARSKLDAAATPAVDRLAAATR